MTKILLEFDKAGAEWFIVAFLSGDENMMEVFRTGKSPHVVTGMLCTGASEELILKEHKCVGMLTDPTLIESIRRSQVPEIFTSDLTFLPRIFSIRQCFKKANHGLNYIMKARRFSEETEMEERDCKRIIDLYLKRAYSNIPLWWESVKRDLRQNNRTLFNCFGRKRRFLEAWGDDLFKQAVAFLPQSTNVDAVNGAMIESYNDDWLMAFMDILAQTHDSITFQGEVSDLKRLAAACVKIDDYMSPEMEYGGRKFRLGTELKIGKSWGQLKTISLTRDIDKLAKDIKVVVEGLGVGRSKETTR